MLSLYCQVGEKKKKPNSLSKQLYFYVATGTLIQFEWHYIAK